MNSISQSFKELGYLEGYKQGKKEAEEKCNNCLEITKAKEQVYNDIMLLVSKQKDFYKDMLNDKISDAIIDNIILVIKNKRDKEI